MDIIGMSNKILSTEKGRKKEQATAVRIARDPDQAAVRMARDWDRGAVQVARVRQQAAVQAWDRDRSAVQVARVRDQAAVVQLSKGPTIESNTTVVQYWSASGLTNRKNSRSSRIRQWDRDRSAVQVARLRDQAAVVQLSKGPMVESNITVFPYWSAPGLTKRRSSRSSRIRQWDRDRSAVQVARVRDQAEV
ncbi:hypothetical protein CBR_g2782 [Chara braunii]|uniref:Uncharacterized protein n=1 Tax=Chara braunii TaxID=69332 RepID=A0A388KDX0_CHABU|nr:hypothetical protein CBR_g2782 [Chara braunii]|eukprot:GBG68231.1 hypothetical protein CBR_g2782 [Chara braunii]